MHNVKNGTALKKKIVFFFFFSQDKYTDGHKMRTSFRITVLHVHVAVIMIVIHFIDFVIDWTLKGVWISIVSFNLLLYIVGGKKISMREFVVGVTNQANFAIESSYLYVCVLCTNTSDYVFGAMHKIVELHITSNTSTRIRIGRMWRRAGSTYTSCLSGKASLRHNSNCLPVMSRNIFR